MDELYVELYALNEKEHFLTALKLPQACQCEERTTVTETFYSFI